MGDHDVTREKNTEARRIETLAEQSKREASIYNSSVAEVRYRVVIVMGMKRFPCETTHPRVTLALDEVLRIERDYGMHAIVLEEKHTALR